MNCLKVYIVEDNQLIREVFEEALRIEGFLVESFANGQMAINRLRSAPEPCLVLLDMIMPVMNGEEFMEEFLKLPVTIVPIPVYLVSATCDKQASQKMGCSGFMKKPVDFDALLLIVRQFCSTSREVA